MPSLALCVGLAAKMEFKILFRRGLIVDMVTHYSAVVVLFVWSCIKLNSSSSQHPELNNAGCNVDSLDFVPIPCANRLNFLFLL